MCFGRCHVAEIGFVPLPADNATVPSVCSNTSYYFNGWDCVECTVCDSLLQTVSAECTAFSDTVCSINRE